MITYAVRHGTLVTNYDAALGCVKTFQMLIPPSRQRPYVPAFCQYAEYTSHHQRSFASNGWLRADWY